MRVFFLISFFIVFFSLNAQQTIKVMQYNLLNYNNYTDYCTATNNNVSAKDAYIKTIIEYELPDIFTVCEMNQQQTSIDRLLSNSLNVSGRTNYAKGNRTNYSNSDLINMIYYNTDKLELISYTALPTAIRDINFYTFIIKDPNLHITQDTTKLTCIIMHLKAGSTAEDANKRATQINILMNYLNAINKVENYLAMGDLNTYTSNEECYQKLINFHNENVRFYDPINMQGNWNNNYNFASIHTQSTHTTGGCSASGGLDDRFDHILASSNIISGAKNIKYVYDSYKALGNDGNHFDKSIIEATNNSVPSNVLTAIYENSDHLPITLDLQIIFPTAIAEYNNVNFDFYIPINSYQKRGNLFSNCEGTYIFKVFNNIGQLLLTKKTDAIIGNNTIDFSSIKNKAELMFISIISPDGKQKTFKTIFP